MKYEIMNRKNILEQKKLKLLMLKNNSAQENLKYIEEKTISTNNLKELIEVVADLKSLNLSFKNEKSGQAYMPIFGLIFVVFWLLSWASMGRISFKEQAYSFWAFFSFTLFGIIYGKYFFRKVLDTKQISDTIILKKVALDNNLVFDKINKTELMQAFEVTFFIFQQGNYSREITKYIKGGYKNRFDYHYFNLHYVDEHTSTSKDANGNKSTSTSYIHYDLYGLIISFNQKSFIKISNYETSLKFRKFIKWKTSSIFFNKKFKVYTDSEQAVAVFLQPKVIEQIEKLYEIFPKLDLELSPHGLLALSTPDKELLNYNRQYGVDKMDLFENEIKQNLDQTKLYKALEFINFLKDYHEQL